MFLSDKSTTGVSVIVLKVKPKLVKMSQIVWLALSRSLLQAASGKAFRMSGCAD